MAINHSFSEYPDIGNMDALDVLRRVIEIRDKDKDAFRQILEILNNLYSDNVLRAEGDVFMPNIKSGTTQGSAGAVADEIWVDTSGGSEQYVLKRGV